METGLSLAKCERTSKMEIFHESLVKQSILIYDFLRQLRRHWTRSAAGDAEGRGSCQTLVGQRIMTLPALLLLPLRAVALKEI